MIRLTRQTDYGIVLMTLLAADPEHIANAPELAQEARLPQPIVSKVLKLLARDGLLVSHRGVKGGYGLARSPEKISLSEIIFALEGPVAMTECIDGSPGDCSQELVCPVRGHWQVINRAIERALQGLSLAEMARPAQRSLVTLGRGPKAAPALAREVEASR